MILREDHRYPLFPHPNTEFLPPETKQKMGSLMLNVFTPNIQTDLIMGTFSGKKFVEDKQDLLIFHGLTNEDVALFDAIVADMMTTNSKFLKHGIDPKEAMAEEGFEHYANAMKAAIQYYLYEPFFPGEILDMLRESNLLYPKIKPTSHDETERLSKKYPVKWEEIRI